MTPMAAAITSPKPPIAMSIQKAFSRTLRKITTNPATAWGVCTDFWMRLRRVQYVKRSPQCSFRVRCLVKKVAWLRRAAVIFRNPITRIWVRSRTLTKVSSVESSQWRSAGLAGRIASLPEGSAFVASPLVVLD
jgi:hypothetical protein